MKRKVIKQGNGTLTLTLPKDWTKKVKLNGGDELDVTESEAGLLVHSPSVTGKGKIQIDATGYNERVTRLVLSAAHKSGYDEIEIIYDNPEIIKVAHELVKELYLGFSIVEQTQKRCVLKAIASDKVEDFENVLRRAFLVALSMADTSLEMIKDKKFDDLSTLVPLEHFNNQLTNFCERALNKKAYKNGSCFYYVVAWNLEKVCDNYKYIADHRDLVKGAICKRILDLYKEVNEFFRQFYEIFYKFDVMELVKLTEKGKSLLKELHKVKNLTEYEIIIMHYLMMVVMQCLDFSASYIAIDYLKE